MNIKAIISDFSNTLLFPVDNEYTGSLNALYKQKKDADEFDFWQYFSFNEHLYRQYQQFKEDGIKIYVFTTGNVQNDEALAEKMSLFDEIFTVASIGNLEKEDSNAYLEISRRIKVEPQSILFIDDTSKNIEAAKNAGLKTLLYKPNLSISINP